MNPSFLYGVSVEGDNFTDRTQESRRLKLNFENGLNVILISPRRMGKTSLVKHVMQIVDKDIVHPVYMDIYDCRSEYDFYNKFVETILKQTSSKIEVLMDNVRRFLARVSPKISMSPDSVTDYSVSLGITPKEYSPEEVLSLPEQIAKQLGKHIVVCIDEFQQVAEWPDRLQVQKRMRGVWQHQQHVSYCLFGSRQHMIKINECRSTSLASPITCKPFPPMTGFFSSSRNLRKRDCISTEILCNEFVKQWRTSHRMYSNCRGT